MITNKPLVSVIIPTYNVEPYLVQCLDSVNTQTYENFECIIIIDGATDRSFEIAKEYCATHPKFKVFYQDNAGSGPARNNGVAHSSGDFVCFIDPDDWVESDYVETLIKEQVRGDYDLVISQSIARWVDSADTIIKTIQENKPVLRMTNQGECKENFPEIMFVKHHLDGPICKLFRLSIIREQRIEYPAYRRSQDMVFNFRYYNHIHSLSVISDHTYNIRYEYPPRPNRGRIFTGYNEIVAKIYLELSKQLTDWHLKSDYKEAFHTWSFVYLYSFLCKSVATSTPYDYIKEEPYDTIIRKARPILAHQKIVRFFLLLHLYRCANMIMGLINKIKKQ